MEHLSYGIPLGIVAVVGVAYALGAFSVKEFKYDTSFIDKEFRMDGGRKRKHSKTKRHH